MEKDGGKINSSHHEAVLILDYLERYMRNIKELLLSYEFVSEEILQENPLLYIKELMEKEAFAEDSEFHTHNKEEFIEYLDHLIDAHINSVD